MKTAYKIIIPILIIILLLSSIIIIIKSRTNEDIAISTSAPVTKLERTIEDANGITFLRIDADVVGADTDSFPVVSLLRYDFTEDDIKNYADSFFDNSEYHNQPYNEEYSVDDMDNLINELNEVKENIVENRPSTLSDADYYTAISDIDGLIASYRDLRATAPTNRDLRCDTTYDPCYTYEEYLMYTNNETTITDYEDRYMSCTLEGNYDNLPYRLWFDKTNSAKTTSFTIDLVSKDTIVWKDYTNSQVTYDSYLYQWSGNNSSIENACIYTEKEAIMLCDSMIKQLGIKDMSVINTTPLSTKAYFSEYLVSCGLNVGTCGYYIAYGKTVNGASLNYLFTGSPGEIFLEDTEELVPGPECLYFIIMDSGIVSMTYHAPTVIDSIDSEATPLLAFDDILSIFEDKMVETYGRQQIHKVAGKNLVVSDIRLGLALVTIDARNGEYTLVPAWTFYNAYDDWGLATINAIDGSIIN